MQSTPTNSESLRTQYRIMTNLWMLAQLRQPGRPLYGDLTKDTFINFMGIVFRRPFPYEPKNR